MTVVKPIEACALELKGIEPDNLLSILALFGLLRALERARPQWSARASWAGPPWCAILHLASPATETEVAVAADEGVLAHVPDYRRVIGERSDVKFIDREALRAFLTGASASRCGAELAGSLTSEYPLKKDGASYAAPLVMMFGQGHQHFLERLVSVSESADSSWRDPDVMERALFQPWQRTDPTDAFRWDPQEDQRYALRFRDPSKDGAAPTVHGANRLAAVGLLSFPCAPNQTARTLLSAASRRGRSGIEFVWPIWGRPMSRAAVEALLLHPALSDGDLEHLRPYGVREIFAAQRVANGKFMNVARAAPVVPKSGGASPTSRIRRALRRVCGGSSS